jgi:hypothetical protein
MNWCLVPPVTWWHHLLKSHCGHVVFKLKPCWEDAKKREAEQVEPQALKPAVPRKVLVSMVYFGLLPKSSFEKKTFLS